MSKKAQKSMFQFGLLSLLLATMVLVGGLGYWQSVHVPNLKRQRAIAALDDVEAGMYRLSPVKLIRAVNRLQALGEQEAIRCLEEFEARRAPLRVFATEPVCSLLFGWEPKHGELYVENDLPFYIRPGEYRVSLCDENDFPVEWVKPHGVRRIFLRKISEH